VHVTDTLMRSDADKVRLALWALLPWPAAIGMRRFYQGVLIADGRTRRVAVGTVSRLLSMSLTGISLAYFDIPGVLTGALALSAGVAVEAFVARRLAFPAIATFLSRDDEGQTMSMGQIWNYYLPLALTPFIALCVQPIITIFLSRGIAPLESLAVLPVLLGLTFVFRALGLSYQEAAIALVGPKLEQRRIVGRFALGLGLFCAGLLGLIALTPLADLWLIKVAGLTPELADFSALPLMLMAIMPGLTVWITWQRSLLLVSKITVPISLSTLLEVMAIIILLALTINRVAVPGITLAALALTAGRLAGILYLEFYCRRLPGGRNKGAA